MKTYRHTQPGTFASPHQPTHKQKIAKDLFSCQRIRK